MREPVSSQTHAMLDSLACSLFFPEACRVLADHCHQLCSQVGLPSPYLCQIRFDPLDGRPAHQCGCLEGIHRSRLIPILCTVTRAPFIMTCVGSTQHATIRLASNAEQSNEIVELSQYLEIVSLTGGWVSVPWRSAAGLVMTLIQTPRY